MHERKKVQKVFFSRKFPLIICLFIYFNFVMVAGHGESYACRWLFYGNYIPYGFLSIFTSLIPEIVTVDISNYQLLPSVSNFGYSSFLVIFWASSQIIILSHFSCIITILCNFFYHHFIIPLINFNCSFI